MLECSRVDALARVHIAQESRERVASEAQLVQKRAHRVAVQRGRQRTVERNVGRKRAPLPRPARGANRRDVADRGDWHPNQAVLGVLAKDEDARRNVDNAQNAIDRAALWEKKKWGKRMEADEQCEDADTEPRMANEASRV